MDEQKTATAGWLKVLRRVQQLARKVMPFLTGMLAALLALVVYNLLFPGAPALTTRDVNTEVERVLASATPVPSYSSIVYQIIQPSLVLIRAHSGDEEDGSLGSGVVIDDQGDILTSLHVVAGADEIEVYFADGTHSPASVIAEQPENDIAVLQASQLPDLLVPATLGNPYAMNVGDDAFVVGNPFGLYSSMSAGVISGFERDFQPEDSDQTLEGLIQIDAAVNPGNSGGPLLNRAGQVVGIVTGILNPTDDSFFVGIGFAVPIDIAGAAIGLPPY